MAEKRIAEGVYVVTLICPFCGHRSELAMAIWPRLIVDRDGMRIGPRVKSTPVDHVCGKNKHYQPEGQLEGQTSIEDHLTPDDEELDAKIEAKYGPNGKR